MSEPLGSTTQCLLGSPDVRQHHRPTRHCTCSSQDSAHIQHTYMGCHTDRQENQYILSSTTHGTCGLKSRNRKTPGQLESPWQCKITGLQPSGNSCGNDGVMLARARLGSGQPLFLSRDFSLWVLA